MNDPLQADRIDPSITPLMTLLAQAERERDAVRGHVQRALAHQQATQAQADQLVAYRGDYERQYRERFKQHSAIEVFTAYQGFMQRLSAAIGQQQQLVVQAEQRVAEAQVALREHELRVASVKKLIERRVQELRQQADRREQKQTDEQASRAAWNRLAMPQFHHTA